MKKLVLVLSLGVLFGCTSAPTPNPVVTVGCSIEQSVATGFATTIQSTLTCSNLAQIQSDLLTVLGKANLCAPPAAPSASAEHKAGGIVGSIVCPIAVNSAMGLMTAKIPSGWGCSPSSTPGSLVDLLTAVCNNAIKL